MVVIYAGDASVGTPRARPAAMNKTLVTIAGALLTAAGCHGADHAETTRLDASVEVQLRPEQAEEQAFMERSDGTRVLSQEYVGVFLLRGAADDSRDALLAVHEAAGRDGELRVAGGDIRVQFHDGRVWLGFAAGEKVPYITMSDHRLVLLDREQIFAPITLPGSLADPSNRLPLDHVLADDARFQPFH